MSTNTSRQPQGTPAGGQYVKSVDPNLAAQFEEKLHVLPTSSRLVAYSSAVGGGRWQMAMLEEIGL